MKMNEDMNRIRYKQLQDKVTTADKIAAHIKDGMTLGLSGFTRAGDAKAVPMALIERAKSEAFKVDVYTGASLGSDIDKEMADAGIIGKRLPFQADPTMSKKINDHGQFFFDQHISHQAELLHQDAKRTIKYAILEAVSITEEGMIITTTSIVNSLAFAENAENIIVEINTAQPDL